MAASKRCSGRLLDLPDRSPKVYGEARHHRHYQVRESIFRSFRLVASSRQVGIYWQCGPGARESWFDPRGLGDFSRSGPRYSRGSKRPTSLAIFVERGGSIQRQVVFFCCIVSVERTVLSPRCPHPTPPRPTSTILDPPIEVLLSIWSNSASRLTKSGSCGNGTVDRGSGRDSGRSRRGYRC